MDGWTRERPTEEGWYWYWSPADYFDWRDGIELAWVEQVDGELMACFAGDDAHYRFASRAMMGKWWLGPITPPAPPKEGQDNDRA